MEELPSYVHDVTDHFLWYPMILHLRTVVHLFCKNINNHSFEAELQQGSVRNEEKRKKEGVK
jgi:hypothetical protein